MLRLWPVALFLFVVLASGPRASAAEIHLFNRALSFADDAALTDASPSSLKHLDLDAGGGADVSLGTESLEFGASFGVGLVMGLTAVFGIVGGLLDISERDLVEDATLVTLGLGFALSLPFVTSALVTWISHHEGGDASYWKVVAWSFISHAVFVVLGLALFPEVGLGLLGLVVGPVVETWAANSGPRFFGGTSKVEEIITRQMPEPRDVVRPSTAARAPGVSADVLAFRF